MGKHGDFPHIGACVEDAELHLALDGELGEPQLELVHLHLSSCEGCRLRLLAARTDRQRVAELLGQEDEREADGALTSVARIDESCRRAIRTAPARKGRSSLMRRIGLSVAATLCLVVASTWHMSDQDLTAAPGRILDAAMVSENAWFHQRDKVLHWIVEDQITGNPRVPDGRYRTRHWLSTMAGAEGSILRKTDAGGGLVFATWRRPDGSVVTYRAGRPDPLRIEPSTAEIRAELDLLTSQERQAAQSFLDARQQDDASSMRARFGRYFVEAASGRAGVRAERMSTPHGGEGYYIRVDRGPGSAALDPGVTRLAVETWFEAEGFRRYRLRTLREYRDGRQWTEDARWVHFSETDLKDFEGNTLTDLLHSMPVAKMSVREVVRARMAAMSRAASPAQ